MARKFALATIALHNMAGGLEKNIVYLANHLASCGHDVSLLSFDLPDATSFYPINKNVKWTKLGRTPPHKGTNWKEKIALLFRIRRSMTGSNKVDTIICFHHGILMRFFVARLFSGIKIIGSERNALSLYKFTKAKKWNIHFLMLFLIHKITVQFPSYIQDYPRLIRSKILVVHNPVKKNLLQNTDRHNIFLSIGRLNTQKRFDLLIHAFSIFSKTHKNWTLKIIGSGSLKNSLNKLIEEHNLQDSVTIIPPIENLSEYFSDAKFYCQPSQWEGFPNAQAEAMSAGVVPLGFSSSRGVADLITDNQNGYLTDSAITPQSYASLMAKAVENLDQWENMSIETKKISTKYSFDSWSNQWYQVLGLSSST